MTVGFRHTYRDNNQLADWLANIARHLTSDLDLTTYLCTTYPDLTAFSPPPFAATTTRLAGEPGAGELHGSAGGSWGEAGGAGGGRGDVGGGWGVGGSRGAGGELGSRTAVERALGKLPRSLALEGSK